jgi:hypothetical protein
MSKPESRNDKKSQVDKFRDAARQLETDESEENFDRVLKRVAKAERDAPKPSPKRAGKKDR